MIKTLRLEKQDCESLLGQFLDEKHYDTLVDFDCDVYGYTNVTGHQPDGEHNCAAIFRKNYFTKEQQLGAYEGLKDAAKPSQNRGLAAGPKGEKLQNRDWVTIEQEQILNYLTKVSSPPTTDEIETIRARAKTMMDTRGKVWLASAKPDSWNFDKVIANIIKLDVDKIHQMVNRILNTMISDTTYANPVDSGIAGWFDRYPRIPYGRATSFTSHNWEVFQKSWPFLQKLTTAFSEFLPERFGAQYGCITQLDPAFYVPGTVFTTITVNKNFRTAAHRDAGDLNSGFSNLTVVAKDGAYRGGYLIVPELRAAFNVRPGDLLLINNHEYIHGNTPIVPDTTKADYDFERISLVCYFREKMLELGCKAYEDLRYEYVEARRTNKQHPEFRDGWNGVGESMWESPEWLDYMSQRGRDDLRNQYHPINDDSSLESLFG